MTVAEAIAAVQNISRNLVVLPRTEEYNRLIGSYNTELERELRPACFLRPSSATQLGSILEAINTLAPPSTVAICGLGRQTTPGVANVHGGLTIHLGNLQGIKVDTERKIVSIAAGEQVGNAYRELVEKGYAVVANRRSHGGIGGDALQGGVSYFSYARGFICDNVVNYEVVLASGDIVNANAETNRDLWVALKGGGNNFGIVTRFDLNIFEQGLLWGGRVSYFKKSLPGQIQSLVSFLHSPNADIESHVYISIGWVASHTICTNSIFCMRPEKPEALKPFADVNPQLPDRNSLGVGDLKNMADEGPVGVLENRVVKMTTTVKANTWILNYALKTYYASIERLKRVQSSALTMCFQPLPVSMMEQSIARGGNSLGLKPSGGPLVVVIFFTSWDNLSDDEKVYRVIKGALRNIDEKANSRDLSASYRYLNCAFTHQDPIRSYGPESKAHLRAVGAKYDPSGFFQTAGSGPFKLRN